MSLTTARLTTRMLSRGLRTTASAQLPHGSTMHGNDPETLEREKQKNLSGESHDDVKHAPGWNQNLASKAEAEVKADQQSASPEELQKETTRKAKEGHAQDRSS
ncbi:hypothetical protein EXIGLDRAFT_830231 [Exidia glandulosa HHB12029]|uniref:Uncharacterized protein n=1 Tax=Exidia glandulosa HHB12029 TaxID=1314781 RepID=A0A165NVE9_EXIGL|nr:hypothetical protein EXIGLDRAFT_830231 [Exidia glandulosa HHB12029]